MFNNREIYSFIRSYHKKKYDKIQLIQLDSIHIYSTAYNH